MGQQSSNRSRGDDIVIVVIGASGSGKSTFINTATQQTELKIGHGLEPCTTKVKHVRCMIDFKGFSKEVVFVDTPAFPGDGTLTIWDIEDKLQKWSEKTYGKRMNFTGILYLYDITQRRMTEPPHLLFKKLCGKDFRGRVLLVTTMWGRLRNKEDGERRKTELEGYWSRTSDKRVARYHGTKESAWDMVRALLG